MIDSHCHLDHEPLFKNISEVLKRSKESGIKKLLTICTTIVGFNNIINILKIDPIIYGTFGIHPHETETNIVNKKIIIENIDLNSKLLFTFCLAALGAGVFNEYFYMLNTHIYMMYMLYMGLYNSFISKLHFVKKKNE